MPMVFLYHFLKKAKLFFFFMALGLLLGLLPGRGPLASGGTQKPAWQHVNGASQVDPNHFNATNQPAPGARAAGPADAGGGAHIFGASGPDLTVEQRQRIQAGIRDNLQRLRLNEDFPALQQLQKVALSWPLQAAAGLDDYGYHGISGFVDHDPAYPERLLDYNCGDRTYDTSSGYNHKGTDLFTWPFSWRKMDDNQVQVVAAANGIVVYKEDGHYDRNCTFGGGDANVIAIRHGDGSIAWYLHFKNGTLTSKPVGATVSGGEYLGIVGSSGNSTGPHLHFELYDWRLNLIDPYQGSCNSLNPDSWWDLQPPYFDPAVNSLATGFAAPLFPQCPEPEISNESAVFSPGSTIYFTAYYRDQLSSLSSQYTIYEPDGSIYHRWTHSSPEDHYAASYWYWSYTLGEAVPTGIWRFEVTFSGQTYTHDFKIVKYTDYLYLPIVQR